MASTAQATSPRVLSGGGDEQEFDWDEFPTCVHEAIAFDQRRWASGPQPPKGQVIALVNLCTGSFYSHAQYCENPSLLVGCQSWLKKILAVVHL